MSSLEKLVRTRIHSGTWALVVILAIFLLQNSLSDNLSIAGLSPRAPNYFLREEIINRGWQLIKLAVFVPAVIFLLLDRRNWLRTSIIVSNGLLTFELFASTLLLVLSLGLERPAGAVGLIKDTIAVLAINILTFSLWYWIVDSDAGELVPASADQPWDFFFPQRASAVPGYANWKPHFADYFFLAFTTTTTFGPADTVPLSRRAKLLMLMETTIAVIALVVLAGRALSIITS